MADFFEGRFQLLHDTEENWLKVSDSFIPLGGEACITLDGSNKGRVKFGDGIHTWGELGYSNDGQYDGKTLVSKNNVIQLVNYSEADEGQIPSKSSNGLEWFTPVRSVFIGEESIDITEGNVLIPVAGDTLGVVKASEEIGVTEEGSMILKKVDANKIQYDDNDSIKDILDKRTSWEKF